MLETCRILKGFAQAGSPAHVHFRQSGLFPAFELARSPGFILASCYLAGAIVTELSHEALKVNPFIPIVLFWIGAFIRERSIFF